MNADVATCFQCRDAETVGTQKIFSKGPTIYCHPCLPHMKREAKVVYIYVTPVEHLGVKCKAIVYRLNIASVT